MSLLDWENRGRIDKTQKDLVQAIDLVTGWLVKVFEPFVKLVGNLGKTVAEIAGRLVSLEKWSIHADADITDLHARLKALEEKKDKEVYTYNYTWCN